MKKLLITTAILLLVAVLAGAFYLKVELPDQGKAPDLKVDITPERVARGKYLAYHVTVCMDCHSTRDWTKYSGPPIKGTDGKGGEYFGTEEGFPGKFYSKNITPFNLESWSDGEIFRTITTGVSKDGSALFPVMPYTYYGKMDKEDIYDIIAFIRTLAPIESTSPVHSLNFPINFLINTFPQKAEFQTIPSQNDKIAYGAYLTNAAGCMECHTPADKGKLIAGKEFTGGRDFKMPGLTLYSANITPDSATGIGSWTQTAFIDRFRSYTQPGGTPAVEKNSPQTIMPWSMYGGMDSSDLAAIYTYLHDLPPVKNKVDHFVMDAVTGGNQ